MRSRNSERNFLPALILTLLWWLLLAGLLLFVEPTIVADFPFTGSYGLFFLLLFLAVWFLFSLLLVNTQRGLLVALWAVAFAALRLIRLGSWLNGLLLAGFLGAVEFHLAGGRLTSSRSAGTSAPSEENAAAE